MRKKLVKPYSLAQACLIACILPVGIRAQTTAPNQPSAVRSRGAQGTREFLGLGTPPDAAAAERGSKTYAATCSFCHGAKATGGDTGPDLIRSTLVLHDEKGNLIGAVVHNGRAARGMPPFPSFTDAELYDVAEFLHMRVELTANRGTYKLLDIVTGDAKAGRLTLAAKAAVLDVTPPQAISRILDRNSALLIYSRVSSILLQGPPPIGLKTPFRR